MRICVIGNSHASTLRDGWSWIAPDHPRVKLYIFARGGGQVMIRLRLRDGCLSMPEGEPPLRSYPEGAGSVIDLRAYDGFVLYGMGLRVRPSDSAMVSRASRQCATMDSARSSAMWNVLGHVRAVSDRPVFIGHVPYLAADTVRTRGPLPEVQEAVEDIARMSRERDATLVAQPEETIVNGHFTDPKYNVGVVPMFKDAAGYEQVTERHTDIRHMNPEFGALMLDRFLRRF